ncbi:hypothetical protein SAMN02800694_1456 [Luteibacter sp. UNCMF331Sha3.1]|uniref:hypothetical protein n=1 Tax=Luteibacter sp. UNCMF331Sha3.1 TaxID=1502760 RepID=UPI0008C54CB5|nr:hypothetical protein [Luteibacter sp. UNCMF331Sha3.1]SEM54492.1 hypothetical protein SAMN02800694_1456 [Luteibacter sp. UNCMF331Sha3.1]
MPVYLIAQGFDLSLELDLAPPLAVALQLQCERLGSKDVREAFSRRISDEFNRLLLDLIDWDLKEPTAAQMAYAIELARFRQETVPIPALRSRGAMQSYIESRLPHCRETADPAGPAR